MNDIETEIEREAKELVLEYELDARQTFSGGASSSYSRDRKSVV